MTASAPSRLAGLVAATVEGLLAAAAAGDHQAAGAALADAAPLLRGTRLLAALSAVARGETAITRAADGLYVAGADAAVAARALDVVAAELGIRPLVLVRAGAVASARATRDIDGIGIIDLPAADAGDLETLVHEMVHVARLCGHRMVDEGLAEWLAVRATSASDADARARLAPRAAAAPPLALLAAQRWEHEPAFESLAAPPGAAHARAALAIADVLAEHGLAGIDRLLAAAETTHDLRPLLACAADPAPDAWRAGAAPVPSARELMLRFRVGDTEGIDSTLTGWAEAAAAAPDDRDTVEAHLRLLLLSADRQADDRWDDAMDSGIAAYLDRFGDTAFGYALCLCREALRIRRATDFIAMNDAFQRARQLAEEAMDRHGDDLDVVTAVAKFELRTPADYGGSLVRGRNLLVRARALADDAVDAALSGRLDAAIESLANRLATVGA
jgi:hypothetical protein